MNTILVEVLETVKYTMDTRQRTGLALEVLEHSLQRSRLNLSPQDTQLSEEDVTKTMAAPAPDELKPVKTQKPKYDTMLSLPKIDATLQANVLQPEHTLMHAKGRPRNTNNFLSPHGIHFPVDTWIMSYVKKQKHLLYKAGSSMEKAYGVNRNREYPMATTSARQHPIDKNNISKSKAKTSLSLKTSTPKLPPYPKPTLRVYDELSPTRVIYNHLKGKESSNPVAVRSRDFSSTALYPYRKMGYVSLTSGARVRHLVDHLPKGEMHIRGFYERSTTWKPTPVPQRSLKHA